MRRKKKLLYLMNSLGVFCLISALASLYFHDPERAGRVFPIILLMILGSCIGTHHLTKEISE